MTVITTNAPFLIDHDGDIAGYDLPSADPINIDTRWITKWGREDELVYVVTWANGITADMFSLPNEWSDIFRRCSQERLDAGTAKLDATLAELSSTSLSQATAQSKARAAA